MYLSVTVYIPTALSKSTFVPCSHSTISPTFVSGLFAYCRLICFGVCVYSLNLFSLLLSTQLTFFLRLSVFLSVNCFYLCCQSVTSPLLLADARLGLMSVRTTTTSLSVNLFNIHLVQHLFLEKNLKISMEKGNNWFCHRSREFFTQQIGKPSFC